MKYSNFEQITRSTTPGYFITSKIQLEMLAETLIKEADLSRPIRLLGLSLSNFPGDKPQDAIQLEINFPG